MDHEPSLKLESRAFKYFYDSVRDFSKLDKPQSKVKKFCGEFLHGNREFAGTTRVDKFFDLLKKLNTSLSSHIASYISGRYNYRNLWKNLANEGNSEIAMVVYFYLHHYSDASEEYAKKIDFDVFDRKTFKEAVGSPVPATNADVHEILKRKNSKKLETQNKDNQPTLDMSGPADAGRHRFDRGFEHPKVAENIDRYVFASPLSDELDGPVPEKISDSVLQPSYPKDITFEISYQRKREEFSVAKKHLLSGRAKSVAVTIAVQGAGGYGKTALAEELCDDQQVRELFPGGIYWLQFSIQKINEGDPKSKIFTTIPLAIEEMLRKQEYNKALTSSFNIETVKRLLELLPREPLLIIGDDVWNASQHDWVSELPEHASSLITTRTQDLAKKSSKVIPIKRLTSGASFALLTDGMKEVTSEQSARLRKVSDAFKGWPLLLNMANAKFKIQSEGGDSLDSIISEYEEFIDADQITGWDAEGADDSEAIKKRRIFVHYCMQAGLDAILNENERDLLPTFGVFPDDTDIPFSVVSEFWIEKTKNEPNEGRVRAAKANTYLRTFNNLSFFRYFDAETQTIRLHDEILAYFRQSHIPDELISLHQDLISSIKENCTGGWETLPAEHQYGWKNLLYHLEAQGSDKQADDLRTDYHWLKSKLKAVRSRELQASFFPIKKQEGEDARQVGKAITLSIPVLQKRPEAFAHQMFGRLGHNTSSECLEHIVENARKDVEFYPKIFVPHLFPLGNELARLMRHEGAVFSAVFSHDSRRIVTASFDTTARLWNRQTGQLLKILEGHDDSVNSAVFSHDSRRIVTASSDTTARLWDGQTGQLLKILEGHDDSVNSAVFSHDSNRIVTASSDTTAQLWDGHTGDYIKALEGHEGSVSSAVFSHDSNRIVTASSDTTARLWDGHTGDYIKALEGHEWAVTNAVFSPVDNRIVTISQDGTACLWDGCMGASIKVLKGHEGYVSGVSFSNDGSYLVTASEDNTARLWDGSTDDFIKALGGHEKKVASAVFSSDGSRIVTASFDRTARLWGGETGDFINALEGHEGVVSSAIFSSDGNRIVTASSDWTARLWNGHTGDFINALEGHEGVVSSAIFSSDGNRIVTASGDGSARLWNGHTGDSVKILQGHEISVNSAFFSSDGNRIVTASDDETARLWDGHTGDSIKILRGHNGAVNNAIFSSDSSHIITTSSDYTARLWDGQTGAFINTLEGHEWPVLRAVFLHDYTRIVTASTDKTLRLWDGQTGDCQWVIDFERCPSSLDVHGNKVCIGLEGIAVVLLEIKKIVS